MLRPLIVGLFALLWVGPLCAEPLNREKAKIEGEIAWYDGLQFDIEGKAWSDTKSPYDRFPARAEKTLRPAVWSLSRNSAGLAIRFVTAPPAIHARWTLTQSNLAMAHMAATGVSGVDLYIRDAKTAQWRWLAVGMPKAQTNTLALVAGGLPSGEHEYLLYFPLYNGVSSLEIGVAKSAEISSATPRKNGQLKPIIFYGTSITQGGCASRPGMVHTAILGRKLDCPVINLGFSGNGKMEMPVVELMAEIDAAMYVIDCNPNMSAQEVSERTVPLVQKLREARPDTPIVLVEDRRYANAAVLPGVAKRVDSNHAALKKAYDDLKAAKVTGLHYIEGDALIGYDGEGTVDSSHPTDLGFLRQAEAMLPVMQPLLKR